MPLLQTASPKRRRIRKGTFSCWECKHRKTRCEFKPSSCSVCVSCRQRGLACIIQEFDAASSNAQVERRIVHVEGVVDQLVTQQNGSILNIPSMAMQSLVPNPSPGVSVSSYLDSIFPPQTKATAILDDGRFIYMPIRMWDTREPLAQVSQRPQSSAHPVQFARKLILFALCLQQLEDPEDAGRYIDNVSRHVTSQDIMVDSVDGIETIMLEATYYINKDDLRTAWLKFRRAIAMAQAIGLDRMDWGDREKNVWMRLMAGDHFTSLVLGLPLAVGSHLLEPPDDSALDFQQTHLSVPGRIIARNICMQRLHQLRYEETQEIDHLLKQSTRSLPPGWWSFRPLDEVGETEVMEMTARLSTQMHHHYFVVILHQPYLLRDLCSSTSSECFSYSKAAIPPSSREVLSRYIAHRSFHRGLSYRGTDEKPFTATVALLLAHIEGHRLGQANVLGHQRPQDLGIINDVAELMEEILGSCSMVRDIRGLVKLESEIANGASYLWMQGEGVGLALKIPFFGTLRAVLASSHAEFDQPASLILRPESLHSISGRATDTIEHMTYTGLSEDDNVWDYVTLGETDI